MAVLSRTQLGKLESTKSAYWRSEVLRVNARARRPVTFLPSASSARPAPITVPGRAVLCHAATSLASAAAAASSCPPAVAAAVIAAANRRDPVLFVARCSRSSPAVVTSPEGR